MEDPNDEHHHPGLMQLPQSSPLFRKGALVSTRLLDNTREFAVGGLRFVGLFSLSMIEVFHDIWGFPEMGVPKKWMVYLMENPIKQDDKWGYPQIYIAASYMN